jgi:hypothetical protein
MTGFDLDHVGIAVADLDAAAKKFLRLGFQLTPRGYHTLPPPAPRAERPLVGTGNHCAMLRRGYLELIGVTEPTYRGRLRADIARHEGLHIVAFGTTDAAATASELRSRGVEVGGPRPLQRPIEDGGETRLAGFDIVDFPETALPEAHFFAIQHRTRELLWRPRLLTHPNGVVSLTALTVAVTDPADFARRLGRILSVTPVDKDGLVLDLKIGRVKVVDGGWMAARFARWAPDLPYLVGLDLGVTDLGSTADLLAQNGVSYERKAASLLVSPADACGAFIELQAAER